MGRRPKNTVIDHYNPTNVLTYLRTRSGLTMTELSQKTGLTINDICRFEIFHHNLSIGKLQRIAEFFGVSMDILWKDDLFSLGKLLKNPIKKGTQMRERIHEKQAVCERIGDAGEEWVYELERQNLAGTPYEDLINPNYSNEESAHFDLLSFDRETGEPRRIEIKSTGGDADEPFYMSSGEWDLMLYCLENGLRYELHRVHHINDKALRGRTIYSPQQVLSLFLATPSGYKLTRKEV